MEAISNMRSLFLLAFVCLFKCVICSLWSKGIVHYSINNKDYDLHSQDLIQSTLGELQNEICLKFFNTLGNYTASVDSKILYISNPDRRKECPPENYDFSGNVVDLVIGYRCLSPKDITRVVVEMLKASIQNTVTSFNSFDLIKKFREREDKESRPGLLSAEDRNYINAHYHFECGSLSQPVPSRRQMGMVDSSKYAANLTYYESRLWPLGVVMYGVKSDLDVGLASDLKEIYHAMATIELAGCVVFQNIGELDQLTPKNFIWLSDRGEDMPELGFKEGNQSLRIASMVRGAPGHSAHTLNMLLRVLGLTMMSNRYDRDNYISVNWKNLEPGKERFLEKDPEEAWLPYVPYDFSSVTHAPANYLCRDCFSAVNSQTITPLQDHLWQKTLSMGHRKDLCQSDIQMINTLYSKQCNNRYLSKT